MWDKGSDKSQKVNDKEYNFINQKSSASLNKSKASWQIMEK